MKYQNENGIMFKHYLKLTFRNLWKDKFQTAFTIIGLAVAFLCFGICAYFVHGFLSMDNYYENHDRVYELQTSYGETGVWKESYLVHSNPEEIMNRYPEVESVFRYLNTTITFSIEDDSFTAGSADNEDDGQLSLPQEMASEELVTIYCDTTLRHVYNPALLAGSWDAAMNSENSMVMTEKYARKLFGSADAAIGRKLTPALGGDYGTTLTVRAVVENLPPNNSIATFLPVACWIMNSAMNKSLLNFRLLLYKGVDADNFNEKLKQFNFNDDEPGKLGFRAFPASKVKSDTMGNEYGLVLSVILLPGLIVLLSALSNFLHLLISGIIRRDREYALRKVNGARTFDLWLMVSTQVLVSMLLVGIATFVIIMLCTPLLQISLVGKQQFQFDTAVMLKQSLQHIGILLLIGLIVAWIATVRIRNNAMQTHLQTGSRHHLWRNIMMGGQMVISFIFVTLLCAMIMQMRKNTDRVYPWLSKKEKREILLITPPSSDSETCARMESALDAIPAVRGYVFNQSMDGLLSVIPCEILSSEKPYPYDIYCPCCPEMLQFLNVPLLEGRWSENPDEIMVDVNLTGRYGISVGDELTADLFLGQDGGLKTYSVTGIIDNAMEHSRYNGEPNKVDGAFYSYNTDHPWGVYMVKCEPGMTGEVRKAVMKNIYHTEYEYGYDPEIPTLYDRLQEMNEVEHELIGVFWLFAGIALIISLLGIYSTVTMETTVRRKEMAVRKINGAKTGQIASLMARLYLWLLLISAAIAFPLTYWFFHLIGTSAQPLYREMFNYGPLFYLCVFLLVAAFVALTVWAQIRRIARIEPYTIVKSE